MDIKYFLEDRLCFIDYFYKTASVPFDSILESIEQEKEPYTPTFCNSEEPSFLKEWQDAQAGLQVLGISTISMLSSTLEMFLNEWTISVETENKQHNRKHKKGWFSAYKIILEKEGIKIESCPADLDMLEQMILVRNRGAHPNQFTSFSVNHSEKDLQKYPIPYCTSDWWKRGVEKNGGHVCGIDPNIHVDYDKISIFLIQIRMFCGWLEKY